MKTEKQLTAVEQLIEQLTSVGVLEIPQGSNAVTYIIEQAKEMEKEQKIEFAKHFLYKCKDLSIVMAYNQVEQELIKHELNKSE